MLLFFYCHPERSEGPASAFACSYPHPPPARSTHPSTPASLSALPRQPPSPPHPSHGPSPPDAAPHATAAPSPHPPASAHTPAPAAPLSPAKSPGPPPAPAPQRTPHSPPPETTAHPSPCPSPQTPDSAAAASCPPPAAHPPRPPPPPPSAPAPETAPAPPPTVPLTPDPPAPTPLQSRLRAASLRLAHPARRRFQANHPTPMLLEPPHPFHIIVILSAAKDPCICSSWLSFLACHFAQPRTLPKCPAISTPSNKTPAPTAHHPTHAAGQKDRSSTAPAAKFPNPHTTLITGDDSPPPAASQTATETSSH